MRIRIEMEMPHHIEFMKLMSEDTTVFFAVVVVA